MREEVVGSGFVAHRATLPADPSPAGDGPTPANRLPAVIDRTVAAIFAAITTLAATALSLPAAGASPAGPGASAVLVLLPQPKSESPGYDESIAEGLASIRELSLGLTSATQGSYRRGQALLDISQGTRVSRSTYSPEDVPLAGRLKPLGPAQAANRDDSPASASAARLGNWRAIRDRAETAPQTIEPGLLAASIPGGAAWISASDDATDAAIPAADRQGVIARRRERTRARPQARSVKQVFRLAGRPRTRRGQRVAGQARDRRSSGRSSAPAIPARIVIATQSPPEAAILPLLPIAVAGLGETARRPDLGYDEPAQPGRGDRHRADRARPPRPRDPRRHEGPRDALRRRARTGRR